MPGDQQVLFQGFSAKQKSAFLGLATPRRYPVQAMVAREDEMGSEMLIVEEGELSVWVRGVKINEAGEGAVLGVSALIEPHARTASLVAETEVRVLHFARDRVLRYLEGVSPKLFQVFFVNAFQIHLNLVRQCEERIVQLSRELESP
jgi:CRP-like cAMP-binding protein